MSERRHPYAEDMGLDLRRLRYFHVTAEEGNISRAAERLGLQQPPLSQQIKALEASLGLILFRRRARGVELTAAGAVLFDETRELFVRFRRALDQARRAARGEEGTLRIGMAPTAPFHPLVSGSLRAFRQAYPQVLLQIEEGLSDEVSVALAEERIDIAFVRKALSRSDELVIHAILEEPLVAALPAGHRAALGRGRSPLPLGDLALDDFIVIGPAGTGLHDAMLAACRLAGFDPAIAQHAPRITTAIGLVAAGAGTTLVPASLKRMRMDGVVYRDLGGPVRPIAFLGLAHRRGDPSPLIGRFLRLVRQAA